MSRSSRKAKPPQPIFTPVSDPPRPRFSLLWFGIKILKYSFVFLLGGVIALVLFGGGVGLLYVQTVAKHAQLPIEALVELTNNSRSSDVVQTDHRKNILILGVDTLANRDAKTVLTDTIMVVSMNLGTSTISTFSYPRDLYIASYSAKINALYELGGKENPEKPTEYVTKTVELLSGLPIHHVVTLDITTVVELIDALGGLDVEVERSFVDYMFPRTDIDVRVERDPRKLYEVVAFTQGVEHMSGDRALRFIRSRHSSDPIEGTDDARVRRQQRVIAALLDIFKNPALIRNPERVGKLIFIYNTYINSSVPLSEAIGVAKMMARRGIAPSFRSFQFKVQTNGEKGLIYHPEKHPSGGWVYLPVDPSYKALQEQAMEWTQ